jgi:hypothetical protein
MEAIQSYVFGPNARTPLGDIPKQLRDTVGSLRESTFGASSTMLGAQPRLTSGTSMALAMPGPAFSMAGSIWIDTPGGARQVATHLNTYRNRGG